VEDFEQLEMTDLEATKTDPSTLTDEVIAQAPVCMLLVARDGTIRQANPEAARLFGWATSELVGAPVEVLIPGPLRQLHVERRKTWSAAPHTRVMGGGSRLQARHADGHLIPVDVMLAPLGEAGALAVVIDRTELRIAETALRDRDTAFRQVIGNVQDVVYVVRTGDNPHAGRVELVSEHVHEVVGYLAREFVDDPTLWASSIHPQDAAQVERSTQELFDKKAATVRTYRMQHKETGEWRLMEDRVAPLLDDDGRVIGYCGAARDVTEQGERQAQMVITERLAAVGMLAASIAHELNNPMTYLLGNVEMASSLAASGAGQEEVLRTLSKAREGAERMRRILGDLSGLARGDGARTKIDPRHCVDLAVRIASAKLSERAELIRRFDDVPPVLADETRLSQVFLNLLLNAAHAIPQERRGEIVVSTRTDDAGHAVIEVVDDGIGMPSHVVKRAFQPFVTSKAQGAGTGLGLYVSQTIVKELGGSISLQSAPKTGTRATVVLPPVE